MDPKRYYVIGYDDPECLVYEESILRQAGLADDAAIEANFEGAGKWVEVWIKRATGGSESEVTQSCHVEKNNKLAYDPLLVADARLKVMVEKWNGIPHKPDTMEARMQLPLSLAQRIDEAIIARMYPSALAHPNFIKAWNSRPKDSETKSPSN